MTLKFSGRSVAKSYRRHRLEKQFQCTPANRKPAFGVVSAKISVPGPNAIWRRVAEKNGLGNGARLLGALASRRRVGRRQTTSRRDAGAPRKKRGAARQYLRTKPVCFASGVWTADGYAIFADEKNF
jgi:hypothetical protein